jgi:hypothetical protein
MLWKKRYHGTAFPISLRLINEGHCSEIMHPGVYKQAPNHKTDLRNLTMELDVNYAIDEVAANLGIAHLLS